MNIEQKIQENMYKFYSGEWTIKTFAEYNCISEKVITNILSKLYDDRITEHRMLCYAAPQPLPEYYEISEAENVEITAKEVHEIGNNKVKVIYESKLNKDDSF